MASLNQTHDIMRELMAIRRARDEDTEWDKLSEFNEEDNKRSVELNSSRAHHRYFHEAG
jgi:hypothetical protein